MQWKNRSNPSRTFRSKILTVLDPVDGVVVGVLARHRGQLPIRRRAVSHLFIGKAVSLDCHHAAVGVHLAVVLTVLLCKIKQLVIA